MVQGGENHIGLILLGGCVAQGDFLLIIKPDLVVASLTSVLEPLTEPQPDDEVTQNITNCFY
jgi:hypothetical protein